jgi:hypothetical protein
MLFFSIRKCFLLSASIFRHPQVFSAIRKYFPPSASIFRHPQVFSAIRKYFFDNVKNPPANMASGPKYY